MNRKTDQIVEPPANKKPLSSYTGIERARLELIAQFKADMAVLDADRHETYVTFENNPLRFKYQHAVWLFKIWCAGYAHTTVHTQEEVENAKTIGE